ncbi:DUF499 domain-containing protein [Streptomyces sp. NPDC003344]|uniref:DUF499 domain-containing protein n=1 Tax=Streptomyces sp. NPDC003344 TaxID=3364682 RepID=UPI00367B2FE7
MKQSGVMPWWKALRIRPEILDTSGSIADVQMSLYHAVYGAGDQRPQYADASYYGEITHPTGALTDLLARIAIRLGGGAEYGKVPALLRLDQGMGGGKSHACIGAYHLGADPLKLAKTDVGQAVFQHAETILGRPLPKNLDNPHVVVLPCDNMTPGVTVHEQDGPAKNLHERFLWRLFEGNYSRYDAYREHFSNLSKISEAITSLGRPVLIIVDEIMNYFGNGLDGVGDETLTAQDQAFMRALLDAVTKTPRTAMLAVMIASDKDSISLSAEGASRRLDLERLLDRNGKPVGVHENDDFAAILRRRIFVKEPSREVIGATVRGFKETMDNVQWKTKVFDLLHAPWTAKFAEEVNRTYPFHPQLMHMAEQEWANRAGFQKVRSTIQVFAATVFALQQRGKAGSWAPLLIGPGDLPLSNTQVRESIIGSGLISDTKTQNNYRSLAQNDIVGVTDASGTARLMDTSRGTDGSALWQHSNPRAAERAATAIFLTSIVSGRSQGRRGATDAEVKAATAVPDPAYMFADADSITKDLTDPETGLVSIEVTPGQKGHPTRYFLSTEQTLLMLQRAMRDTITDAERDTVIADFAEHLTETGPFDRKLFVRASTEGETPLEVLAGAGIDDARASRLVVLDPAQFTLRNGADRATRDAIQAAVGLGDDKLPARWASSAVFVVANTQQRHAARRVATHYLAAERVLGVQETQDDPDMKAKATVERNEAKRSLETHVKRAFQHILFLAQPDDDAARVVDEVTIDGKTETALDGMTVWKALVEKGKAFDQGTFTAKALLHNLRESDYGRPLDELRDSFWNTPRLPLLHGGQNDLRQALFDAVQLGILRIVNGENEDVAVTGVSEINLSSQRLRVGKPLPPSGDDTVPDRDGGESQKDPLPGDETDTDQTPDDVDTDESPVPQEKQLAFSVTQSMLNNTGNSEALSQLFRQLYLMVDNGDVSFLQGSIQMVVNAHTADGLVESVRALGSSVHIRDM